MSDSSVTILDSSGAVQPIDGELVGSDFQQTVTIGDGANAGRVAGVDSAGRLLSRNTPAASATGTVTSVTAATTSATLHASNTARLGLAVYNDSTAILYLALAAPASTTSYTVQIPAGGYYELPTGVIYTGIVTGIWSAANGAARVTELT
jgi:hypothetical protein